MMSPGLSMMTMVMMLDGLLKEVKHGGTYRRDGGNASARAG